MLTKLKLLLFFSICWLGCTTKSGEKTDEKYKTLNNLLKEAEDKTIPANKRLPVALKIDSVAAELNDAPGRVAGQRIIATLYLKLGNSVFAEAHFLKAAELAKKIPDYETLAIALNNLGIITNERSEYDSALMYYNDAYRIFDANNNQLSKASVLVNTGIVHKNRGDFEKAFKTTIDAAKILDSLNDQKDLAAAYTTLGNILKESGRFDEALNYHMLSLQIRNNEKDSAGIASSLNNIGNTYRSKKENSKALAYYLQSLEMKEKFGLTKLIGTTVDNIAEEYVELKEYAKAEEYFNKALGLRSATQDKDGFLSTSNNLSDLYLKENDLKKAKSTAVRTQNLMPKSGYLKQRLDNTLILAAIFRQLKQYDSATKYAFYGIELKDSLFNSNLVATISEMNTRFRTAQKEKELLLSQQLQYAQTTQIHSQRNFISLLGIILLLLSLAVFLSIRSNKIIKRANQRIEILMEELVHRVKNNLQILRGMLHLQMRMATDANQAALIQASLNRVESMNILHGLLYKGGFNRVIEMKGFIESLILNLAHTYQDKSGVFDTSINIQSQYLDIDKAIPIGLITNELITNIYKYGMVWKERPKLTIKITSENRNYRLEITDNCETWNIREIKAKKNGIGLFLVETLVQQLKGSWNYCSNEEGTTHLIEFSK